MTFINRFESKEDFLQFRDHVANVLAEKSIVFKKRKLDELVAQIAGVKDFNTALAICSPAAQPAAKENILILGKLESNGSHSKGRTRSYKGFETEPFFAKALKEHMLLPYLYVMIDRPSFFGSIVTDMMKDTVEEIAFILENNVKYNGFMELKFDDNQVRRWLEGEFIQQHILSAWILYRRNTKIEKTATSLEDFIQRHKPFYMKVDSDENIESFIEAMGPAFKLVEYPQRPPMTPIMRYGCSFQDSKVTEQFSTKIAAICHFLHHFQWDGFFPRILPTKHD